MYTATIIQLEHEAVLDSPALMLTSQLYNTLHVKVWLETVDSTVSQRKYSPVRRMCVIVCRERVKLA